MNYLLMLVDGILSQTWPWNLWPWAAAVLGLIFLWLFVRWAFVPTLSDARNERGVDRVLRRRLDSSQYRVLGNLLLPDGKGGFTQVDHVVLSPFGIFVIETKIWSGGVFGKREESHWTLSFSSGRRRALNPLIQNAKHVRVISALLNVDPNLCHNLVFLTSTASLKNGPVVGVFQSGMIAHIGSFSDPVLSMAEVKRGVDLLQEASLWQDPLARAAHRRQVRSRRKVRGIGN